MASVFRRLWLILLLPSVAHALTAGPNTAGTGVEDSSFGTTVWTNPGNITSSDDTYATAVCVAGVNTRYLSGSSFNFSISTNATILGIQVEWERQALCGAGCVEDSRIRIVKGGVVGSTEKSVGLGWASAGSDRFDSFGGASDLWGETWTPADINASNFGAVLSATGVSGGGTAEVDSVRITVTYTAAASQGMDFEDFF